MSGTGEEMKTSSIRVFTSGAYEDTVREIHGIGGDEYIDILVSEVHRNEKVKTKLYRLEFNELLKMIEQEAKEVKK